MRVQMNWEANQVIAPGVAITNFPTMLFFPANNKTNPIPYTGMRWVSHSACPAHGPEFQ
jgi:hypothetical protein